MTVLRSVLVALILGLVVLGVGAPVALAAGRSETSAEAPRWTASLGLDLGQLKRWLSQLWSKEGCGLDPLGQCGRLPGTSRPSTPVQPPRATGAGCSSIEAVQGCAPRPAGDAGCGIDPLGCGH